MSRTHSIITGATLVVAALILAVQMNPASAQSPARTASAPLGPVNVAPHQLATLGFFNASRMVVRVRLTLYSRATGERIAVADADVPPGSQAFLDSPTTGLEGDAIAGIVSAIPARGSAQGTVGSISLQVIDAQTGAASCCHVGGDISFDAEGLPN